MTPLKLALDWIPNPIHSGIFVAFDKGWYDEAGILLEIISPQSHDFKKNPYMMAQTKEVDLAINPSECVIVNHQLDFDNPIMAVAAVLQGFPTAIVKNNAANAQKFQYGAFGIPFEQTIVQEMAKAVLPDGEFSVVNPSKADIYESLSYGRINISWLFKPIEGVEAEYYGWDYSYFPLEENGIPYGYSPILMAHPEIIKEKENILKDFIRITGKGYHFAKQNTEDTVTILLNYTHTETFTDSKLLLKMQQESAKYYLNDIDEWGKMSTLRWKNYLEWLEVNHAITPNKILSKSVFTNQLF